MGRQIRCDHLHVGLLEQASHPAPVDGASPKAMDQHGAADEWAGLGTHLRTVPSARPSREARRSRKPASASIRRASWFPHRAQPGTALGKRDRHAVHRADAVIERGERVVDIHLGSLENLKSITTASSAFQQPRTGHSVSPRDAGLHRTRGRGEAELGGERWIASRDRNI